jgi:hypothetical protein
MTHRQALQGYLNTGHNIAAPAGSREVTFAFRFIAERTAVYTMRCGGAFKTVQ